MSLDNSGTIKLTHCSFEYVFHQVQAEHNIVFLNGYRTHFRHWRKLYECLNKEANMLFYNRLGIGESSKPRQAQDGKVVLRDLRELLAQLSFKPPYLLVAHSLGGLFADLFTRCYPDEVSGLVLLDAPHPEEIPVMKAYKIPILLRALNAVLQVSDRLHGRYVHSEDEQIMETLAMIESTSDFPDIPLAVLSGTLKVPLQPQHFFEVHQAFQEKLLRLSSRSKRYLCEKSAHFPHLSEPNVVHAAIKNIWLGKQ